MNISEIMTTKCITASENDSAMDAARLMRDNHVGCLPVIENNMLTGIITDRDIVTKVIAEGMNPSEQTVSSFMSTSVVTVTPEATPEQASFLMADKAIRRLPVLENDTLVGIVSLGDLARAEEARIAGEALGEISKPSPEERKVA